ncbi:DEAD/DEAH box helicase family protein [Halonatronum saccharophilum]|uniref:DEAD/DEAH box helicase family protein n=1 Tax=Halonatronum saccharophilum TaxID=150060 RepID=UPI000487DEFE|nr:DEAD/DEAH box helicase family protein [Halonatronum saccharophilum]
MQNSITGRGVSLYSHLIEEIRKAKDIKILVSFLRESGVKLILKELKKQALKGADIKIITSRYMNITEPSALSLLKYELGDMVDLRFFSQEDISFHPKSYFFKNEKEKVLFIGSSNLSYSALISGVEWNYRLVKETDKEAYDKFEEEFNRIYNEESIVIDKKVLNNYASNWRKPRKYIEEVEEGYSQTKVPEPRGAQIEALCELKLAREEGYNKGMVVAATGIGKTYLAAFDSINFTKVLFIAHREEILKQAEASYKTISPNLKTSFFNGEEKDKSGKAVFASVQTLGKEEYLNDNYFKKEEFEYIIVDEFHHAAADTYKRAIDYFEPNFLLGLTATPYRMDNKDINQLCDDNIIYEINLKDAINRQLLVPFKYYGIYDSEVDYNQVQFSNSQYNTKDLEKNLSTHQRADLILKHYNSLAGKRTIGFCASISHANYMAQYFNDNNIKAVSVHSSKDKGQHFMERDQVIANLSKGDIDIIFAVDIFNEGIDIPSLDTVLFLRPTESYVLFLQQLGRGLRKDEDSEKEHLKVLDFIGNYKRAHYIPLLLSGKNPMESKKMDIREIEEFEYPDDCKVSFDFKVIDLFKEMAANDPLRERMRDEYFRLKNSLGRRPLRKDIYEGVDIDIKEYTRGKYKGYLRFLDSIGELNENEKIWLDTIVEQFLLELEKTSMSKSYKIPTLLSLLDDDNKLKREVSIGRVGEIYMNFYKEYKVHQKDLNNKRHKNWKDWAKDKFIKEAVRNPIKYLSKRDYFIYDEINKKFMLVEELEPYLNKDLAEHFLDILKYRKTYYFRRRFKE